MCQLWVPSQLSSPSRLILRSGRLRTQSSVAPWRVMWVNPEGSSRTQGFQTRVTSRPLQVSRLPQPLPPCLSETWTANHTNLCPSAWRTTESSVTCGGRAVVLNNPYSEKEQVSGGVSLAPTLHGSLNVLGKTSSKPPWGENQPCGWRNGVGAQPAALSLDCSFGL